MLPNRLFEEIAMKPTPTRRNFLRQTAATGIAASTLSYGVHTLAQPKPTELRLGIIGCGGIMTHHVKGLVGRNEAVSISWLCDVDPRQIAKMAANISRGFQPNPPKQTSRYEDVLNDKSLDAVIIATPHHWHAPIAIAAMQEGKDVYVEKPISHVFDEGPLIIAAAKKYGRVVQQGSQMRSSPVTAKARKLLDEGIIGDIKIARAWTAEMRSVVKPVADSKAPQGVDYDRWLGPAPKHAFNAHRFHGSWRMYRDYANGEIGDDGIHDLDMAAWGLGVDSLPKQITARGSRMLLHGHASEYPDNMNVTYEFPNGTLLVYENYPFTAYGLHGFDNGNVFYGTQGYMIFSRRGAFSVFLGPKNKPGPTEGKELRGQKGYAEHMADFLNAVRSRNRATAARPELAHLSCALVHLGEIAFRTSGRADFDPETERFVENSAADALLSKEYRVPFGLPS
ncbi:MAG: putative dehydrogenase [Pirellulaceae bacterium]